MNRFSVIVIMALATALASDGIPAEVFKCVDEARRPSYQGTSCPAGQSASQIDRRYSNVGSLGLDAEAREQVEAIHRARKERATTAAAKRNAAIRRTLERQAREDAECRRLKDDVQALYLERRYRRIDRDARDQLVRRMREVCAP